MYRITLIQLSLFAAIAISNVFTESELNSASFATSINKFSCDFLKLLNYGNDNIIYSPLSISMALGMVLKGAKGSTAEQLYNVLNLKDYSNKEKIHTYLSDIMKDSKLSHDQEARNISIELANLVLTSKSYDVQKSFTDAMKDEYEAAVGSEDFAADGPKIKETVNKFVKERTHGLIPKILDQPLPVDTVLLLLNSLYFKAYWERMFYRRATHSGTFYNSDKTESTVEFMSERFTSFHRFVDSSENVTILEMNYLGNASMIFVLPHERYGLQRVINSVSCEDIEEKRLKAEKRKFPIKVPKFKFNYEANLKQILPKMGLSSIFTTPDLSGIAPNIKVSEALHKAIISVDEGGTEAAAITKIRAVPLSGYHGPTFEGDHPFLFFIRDKKTGINLFAGIVNKL